MLTILNTLTNTKETLTKTPGSTITMYVCGITPYDYAHVGHGRCYVTFDVLYRLLSCMGYTVTYCRNFTDIDDKLLARAEREHSNQEAYQAIAQKYILSYTEDMCRLNCLAPTVEPRVTEHIPQIIAFIEQLIVNDKAYVVDGDVYFNIAQFPEYGKLSKRNIDDLLAGARVQVRDNKRNPLDFALWKSAPTGVSWQSPWGPGRPGWHIECSALASTYLGQHIDIHAGGMDLIFPHHENEIAQSEGVFGAPFARYWMHNAFVQVAKEKMSKSLNNFFTLRQIFEEFDPRLVRYYILTHHYRVPLDFSKDDIAAAKKSYQRLSNLFTKEREQALAQKTPTEKTALLKKHTHMIVESMLKFLQDDLNTPGMFGVVFENFKLLQEDAIARFEVFEMLNNILGLPFDPLPEVEVAITPEIKQLLAQREQARLEKNWSLADQLRDQLVALGVSVKDQKL